MSITAIEAEKIKELIAQSNKSVKESQICRIDTSDMDINNDEHLHGGVLCLLDLAAKPKHFYMIYTNNAAIYAAEHDDLSMLKYLYEEMGENKPSNMKYVVFNAIVKNHVKIIQYLYEDMNYLITLDDIQYAIEHEHIELADYLIELYEGQAIGH